MNSKQRRHNRVFEHEVIMWAKDTEKYFQFDRRVDQAKMWLQWNTKRKNWLLDRTGYNYQTFKFRSGAMASMFALKWL